MADISMRNLLPVALLHLMVVGLVACSGPPPPPPQACGPPTCLICAESAGDVPVDAADGTACGEGAAVGTCQGGLCEATDLCAGVDCDDGFACTGDSCADGICSSALAASFCLISDACYDEGELNVADDCQICDVASDQSSWSDAADDTACGSDAAASTCQAGVCELTDLCADVACDDGFACTDDSCDPQSGACVHDSTGCGCFTDDDCEDELPCSSESCAMADGWSQCEVTSIAGCLIEGACWSDLDVKPEDPCLVCDLSTDNGQTSWSPNTDGKTCGDGDYCLDGACVTSDCQSGECEMSEATGWEEVCSIQNVVTGTACDEGKGICYKGDCNPYPALCAGAVCDDEILCTIDFCDPQTNACVHDASACNCLTNADCSDDLECTVDHCDMKYGTSQCQEECSCVDLDGDGSQEDCTCAPKNVPDGESCDDGAGACEGGLCQPGP